MTAEAFVYTFKDGSGLLSPLAHDLTLRVTRLEVKPPIATFDAASLKVESASGALPGQLYGEIEKNVRNEVLKSARFPVIRFEATEVKDQFVAGRLTLCGVTRDIRCSRRQDTVEYELDQRDFGIKPFSAMLGTLRVKPQVRVVVRGLAFAAPPA